MKGILDFLPEIRWADFPVSLLSFERRVDRNAPHEPAALSAALRCDMLPLLARLHADFQSARGRRSNRANARRLRRG